MNIRSRAIGIVLVAGLLVWAFFQSGINLGQDLKGGTTLRFALDIEGAKKSGRVRSDVPNEQIVEQTLKIIDERINATGLAETNLTQYGDNKFEISLPAGASGQSEGIIAVVSQLGDLRFMIEVLPDSQYLQRLDQGDEAPPRKGVWKGTEEAFAEFKTKEIDVWKKAFARGEKYIPTTPPYRLVKDAKEDGSSPLHFHIVEETKEPFIFDGGMLENPVTSVDQLNQPVVVFDVKNEFQNVFGQWTEMNVRLPMAIILNEAYHSAPTIRSKLTTNVQISLGRGPRTELEKEAETLATVLQTGSLKIQPTLEAQNVMGPSLAGQSRDRGILAVIIAFGLVLVFMILYYRSSGIIANIALLLNLVMLVGFMAFFQAVLTLPGIAGIVLTVGMAVDANILINERIREERRGGRTLRRAMSEGYDRALSAIVDANVTSIITAIFLYNFGSGPVRGFAVTLAIGLMVSMFTAIFVTRTVFEWLLKNGWIKELSAWGSGEPTKIRWLSLRRLFAPISVIGVVAGLFIFSVTDKYTLYDIDFTGGYKIQAEFNRATTPDEVGKLLATTSKEVEVDITEFDETTKRKVTRTEKVVMGPYPDAQVLAAGETGRAVEIKVQRLFSGSEDDERKLAPGFSKYVREVLGDRLMPDWMIRGPEKFEYVAPENAPETPDPLEELSGGSYMTIALRDPSGAVTPAALEAALSDDLPFWVMEDGVDVPYKPADKQAERKAVVRRTEGAAVPGLDMFEVWLKTTTAGGETRPRDIDPLEVRLRLEQYLGSDDFKNRLKRDIADATARAQIDDIELSKAFPSEDHIGSSVAERLKNDAIVALFLSLIGIIIYIAVRFHSRAMGFAAVICLFHDVAITLGLVAVANSLGIVDAKINLAMVAAFLTLVGYSVNDTVVVFDRIRENRGKRPSVDAPLINLSINQMLTRTIRTTATFLLVCFALFGINYGQRNVLEGFAFLLILGSIIGTYSTIAISTPLLLYLPWLWERVKGYAPNGKIVSACFTNVALIILTPVAAVLWFVWAVLFGVGIFAAGLVLFVPWALSGDGDVGEKKPATATA
ncbi:MAG: protein translocase subunit SecD [Planctomycetota bacterium]|nr:protein translocase subunit SecD [Planctomycetota bacterium]